MQGFLWYSRPDASVRDLGALSQLAFSFLPNIRLDLVCFFPKLFLSALTRVFTLFRPAFAPFQRASRPDSLVLLFDAQRSIASFFSAFVRGNCGS